MSVYISMYLCISFFENCLILQHEVSKIENFFELKNGEFTMSCEETWAGF